MLFVYCRDQRPTVGHHNPCSAWIIAALKLAAEGLFDLRVAAIICGAEDASFHAITATDVAGDTDGGDRTFRPGSTGGGVFRGAEAAAKVFYDASGRWGKIMRVSGARGSPSAMLVRPDGHIAATWERGPRRAGEARDILLAAFIGVLGKEVSRR
jgi:hypothetical protein